MSYTCKSAYFDTLLEVLRRCVMKELSVPIAAGGKKPIYEQIYDYIKKEIRGKECKAKCLTSISWGKTPSHIPATRASAKHPKPYYQGEAPAAARAQTAIPNPPVDFGEQKDDLPF